MFDHPLIHLDQANVHVYVDLAQKWTHERRQEVLPTNTAAVVRRPTDLLAAVMKHEDDGGGEEEGQQADRQAQNPVIADRDVEVEGGEDGTPQHHVQNLGRQSHSITSENVIFAKNSVIF